MAYVVLFEILVILLLLAWFVSGKDILSPSVVFISIFLFVVVMDIAGLRSWNQQDCDTTAMLIVIVGCSAFLLGSLISGRLRFKQLNLETEDGSGQLISFLKNPKIENWKLFLLAIILFFCVREKLFEVQRIGGGVNVGLSEAIRQTRFATNQVFVGTGDSATESFSSLEKVLEQFVLSTAMVIDCYIAALIVNRQGVKKLILPGICFVLCCIFSLLGGGRAGTLGYVLMLIVPLVLYPALLGRDRRQTTKKALVAIVASLLVLLPLFYLALPLLGRVPRGNMVAYISFFFGSGIPALSDFTSNASVSALTETYPGLNTFYVVYSTLYKLGAVNSLPPVASNFISLGDYWTNVYTCFYRYYADFGLVGVAVLSLLAGLLYASIYSWAISNTNIYALPIWLLLFRLLIDVGRDESLFGHQLFSPAFYLAIVFIVILSGVLFSRINTAEKTLQENTYIADQVLRSSLSVERRTTR